MNWLKKLWAWLTSTETANSATLLLAQGAGTAAAVAIVQNVDKNNKSGTAKDVVSIANAVNDLLTGKIPTSERIGEVLINLKANSSTTNYAMIAHQFISAFSDQLSAWAAQGASSAVITQYARAFIAGLKTGAQIGINSNA